MIPAILAPSPFPGAIYDSRLVPVTPNAPKLLPTILDRFPRQSVISNDGPATYGIIWVLADGARWAAVRDPWLTQAAQEGGQGMDLLDLPASRDRGRCGPISGRGILLLARDPEAHADVQRGLQQLFQMVGVPRWRMMRA